jgi:5-oxoprolinase (ATP-hydrolysing) subunit A
MKYIDINCDMGEGYGAYTMGSDEQMLEVVSTVNLACGFHAGDPGIMFNICTLAKSRGIAVGAHPGYPDLWGFGRRHMQFSKDELKHIIAYQIGAAQAVALASGHRITHVKAHGALGHLVADDPEACEAMAETVASIDPALVLSVMAGTGLEAAGERYGLKVAREIYADRAYLDNGRLVPRSRPGAVIHDALEAARRVVEMIKAGAIITESGIRIPVAIDTVCVHGDTPNALPMARAIRAALEFAGVTIRPYVVK